MGEQPDDIVIHGSIRRPAGFEVIFHRHYDVVRRYAQRRAGNAVGEEIAAQTFLIAFDRRRSFRGEGRSARPWLLGIATNLIRHHARDEANHLRILEGIAPSPSPADPDDTDRLEALRLAPVIAEALSALPDPERDALLLFALADLSYFEIAQALDVAVGTVRSRIHRARGRLREQLGPLRARPDDGAIG